MKPDYKNWMPKGMIAGFAAAAAVSALVFAAARIFLADGTLKTAVLWVSGIVTVLFAVLTVWGIALYRAFDYNGRRRMSAQIIGGVSDLIHIPDGGTGLDVGCGSGALTIACAKKNPNAKMLGIDRWGKEYASFSLPLCERNAQAEGVNNTEFRRGDAVHLDFPDGTFDAVTSNYVYHNILTNDRQALLRETLRCLKKGGTFAIHDLFSKARYGDMQAFLKELKDSGCEHAELIDTTDGKFMSRAESVLLGLTGSAILYGKK